MQFIDEEAEVDDEDEEEEVEDDELLEDVDDAVDAPPGAEHDDRGHRELDRQRQVAMDLDAEKQAEALRQKYGRQSRSAVAQVSGIPQHLLLPSVDDPMIWAVRCKNGKENEVINSIMKRFADRMHTREPLGITAAFVRAGSTMSGYVYVEARRKDQVDKAVEEISFCYPRTKTMLIPIKEMPDLLRVTKPKSVEIGMYCRLKRPPKYAGDLAQIVGVEANGSELTVRIIPRLDYGQEDDPHGPQGPAKRKRAGGAGGRPPQRLFNEVEARKKFGAKLQPASGSYNRVFLFHSESYEDGFLVKDVKIGTVQLEDVNATLEEVTRFAAGDEGGLAKLDLSAIAETMKKGTITGEFLPDDVVEIYQGEQQGVRGKATAVQGDIVTIKVSHGPLKGEIVQAPVRTLRKLFDEGDHVKVTGASKYQGEVGMVVRVKDDRITLITDADNQEITVFSRDLRAAMDSSGPILGSKYALFDLVQLDAATVACVVKVERESLKVLDQHGSVRTVLPSSITQKLDNGPRTVATDRDGNEVHANDTVKEYSGEQRSGNVLHVHRNFLFCHDRTGMENVGVFVVRSAGVTILSAVGGRVTNTAIDLTKMNPALLQPGASNGGAMGPPKNLAMRDRLPGKTVLIKKGPFKGLVGLVKDTTATHARVELHSRKNLATVPKEDLVMKDPFTGETIQFGPGNRRPGTMGPPGGYGNNGISPRTPLAGSRTPMGVPSGGRTPAWQQGDGGRTPAWKQGGGVEGGRTPAWANASGGRTPAWQPDGGRTVNPYANDGGTTSYGGVSLYADPFLPRLY
jgi:transcription elongation factor SPT5